jgi:hypothetical protein
MSHAPVLLVASLVVVNLSLVLQYGVLKKNGIVEKLNPRFCRTSTPCYMIYGELGRVPLDCQIKLNIRLLQCENKISNTLYTCRLMLRLSDMKMYNLNG